MRIEQLNFSIYTTATKKRRNEKVREKGRRQMYFNSILISNMEQRHLSRETKHVSSMSIL